MTGMTFLQHKTSPKTGRYVRKRETDQEYQITLAEWKSTQPHEAEVKLKENVMNNKYYTETSLLVYLKLIQDVQSTGRKFILQEDNDPSQGTEGTGDNLARRFKQEHHIELLKHPAQSLDLDLVEGTGNIPKQRVRKRQWN